MPTFRLESVITRSFGQLPLSMVITGLIHVPFLALIAAVDLFEHTMARGGNPTEWALMGGYLTTVIAFLARSVATAALIHCVFHRLRGEPVHVGACLRTVLSRAWPTMAYTLMSMMLCGLGILLFVVPGLVWMSVLYVGLPAVVVEQAHPLAALRRSARLTQEWRWHILALIVLTTGIEGGVGLAAHGAAVPLAWATHLPVDGFVLFAFGVFRTALVGVFATVAYHDLRVRQQDRDPSTLAAAVLEPRPDVAEQVEGVPGVDVLPALP